MTDIDTPSTEDSKAAESWVLVQRAQAGDVEAFGQIYDRYVDMVFRYINFRASNRQLAEDLTADTFFRALKRIGSFTYQGRDFGAWLITIARNLINDWYKSAHYARCVLVANVLDTGDRQDDDALGQPETAAIDHITNARLMEAVSELTPEQRECLVLRFFSGLSVAETADAMGKKDGAIKALQYRAVRQLRRIAPDLVDSR